MVKVNIKADATWLMQITDSEGVELITPMLSTQTRSLTKLFRCNTTWQSSISSTKTKDLLSHLNN